MFILFVALVVGLIFLFRSILSKRSDKLAEANRTSPYMEKKYYSVDLVKYRPLIANLGWILSLGLVLTAFEFPTFEEQELMDLGMLDGDIEEIIAPPPTEQKLPPPPKIQQPQIIEVPDEQEIEQEIEIDLDIEIDEETVIEDVVFEESVEEEVVENEIFEVVEEQAAPVGGMSAFLNCISKSVKYPNQARRMGVEGRVYLQFVVEKDGTFSSVRAIKGPGSGLDEEAERVVRAYECGKWKPGKQRGKPVRSKFVLPIKFSLG